MKRTLVRCFLYGSILTLLAVTIAAQNVNSSTKVNNEAFTVKAKVDRRVELLTIVARLAGFEEYSKTVLKTYSHDIDRHFEKYRQHSAIIYVKELRKNQNLGYDAVMTMAVHLSQSPELVPRVIFTRDVIDDRWGSINKANEFVKLLQKFYEDADCEKFFDSQSKLYKTAEQRFQKLMDKVDFDWYRRFYGELPDGSFNLYIRLQNGGSYGPEVVLPNGKKDVYAILGTWEADDAGLPLFSERRVLPTIIHEFNHSFVNHLFFANLKEFKPAGEKIFASVKEKLKLVGYGNWESVVIESLVGAAVIRYLIEHEDDQEVVNSQIIIQKNRGFIWIKELVTLLGVYENSRKAFPTFSSLFPLIKGYFDNISKRIEHEAKIFGEMSPRVKNMSPFANGSQNVDPNIKQLTMTFDKPLDREAIYSISHGNGGEEHYPIVKIIGFDESGTALTVEVKLKADWEYEFKLTGSGFRTKDGYPLQAYIVKFKTRKPRT